MRQKFDNIFRRVKIHLIQRLFVVNHHRRSAQVWHVFSRDFTVLPAHPHIYPQSEQPYLPLPFQPQLVLIYRPWRDGRLSRPWCEVAQVEIRIRNLPIANQALYHTDRQTLGDSKDRTYAQRRAVKMRFFDKIKNFAYVNVFKQFLQRLSNEIFAGSIVKINTFNKYVLDSEWALTIVSTHCGQEQFRHFLPVRTIGLRLVQEMMAVK